MSNKLPRIKKNCLNCNKELKVSINDKRKFCSHKCSTDYNCWPRIKKNCLYCGKEFESLESSHRKFCSKSCSQKRNWTNPEYREKMVSIAEIMRGELMLPKGMHLLSVNESMMDSEKASIQAVPALLLRVLFLWSLMIFFLSSIFNCLRFLLSNIKNRLTNVLQTTRFRCKTIYFRFSRFNRIDFYNHIIIQVFEKVNRYFSIHIQPKGLNFS